MNVSFVVASIALPTLNVPCCGTVAPGHQLKNLADGVIFPRLLIPKSF